MKLAFGKGLQKGAAQFLKKLGRPTHEKATPSQDIAHIDEDQSLDNKKELFVNPIAAKDIEAACNAIEELEDTAKLAMMMRGLNARMLSNAQVDDLITHFNVEWDK